MVKSFKDRVLESGVEFTDEEFTEDLDVIKLQIKRSIARNLWGDQEAHRVGATGDVQLQNALALFNTHAMLIPENMDQ